eukprot:CAMPEP_0178433046 /NCGR_PEP_ID=MMETSP0689_2-20121128/32703_1 /TAXON_ID=160604 /ORGANISM="Amphidinium massartii, Strain CS-259" /LENGTH=76 /DNA_ID=CAMNT_0020055061 /DNA_START=225 /DNA_END=454 /DNA_ORIENTATION=+
MPTKEVPTASSEVVVVVVVVAVVITVVVGSGEKVAVVTVIVGMTVTALAPKANSSNVTAESFAIAEDKAGRRMGKR